MHIDQIRAPDISEICKDAQQDRTAFLAAGCWAVNDWIKSVFSASIVIACMACRSGIRLFNTCALKPIEHNGQ